MIPRHAVPHYFIGARFPCRVAADDPGKVALIDDTGLAGLGPSAVIDDGVPGIATVLSKFSPPNGIEFSGKGKPHGLRLEIQIADGRPDYVIRLVADLPPGRKWPGDGERLAVTVDPEDPRRVHIRWDDPVR